MGKFLVSLDRFAVRANVSTDVVLLDGQKLQFDRQVEVRADPSGKLWSENQAPRIHTQFIYDGRNFTLYGTDVNYYASFESPPTIGETLAAAEKYNVDFPLADLFLWGNDQDAIDSVKSAIYVGIERINGVVCNHYAFHQEDVDWQVCIQRGDAPLPLKLVITSTQEDGQPQYVAVMQWDTSPDLSKQEFTFMPRENDHKIAFETSASNASDE